MRDKGLVFEEMRKTRRTLGLEESVLWIGMVLGLGLLLLAAASMVR